MGVVRRGLVVEPLEELNCAKFTQFVLICVWYGIHPVDVAVKFGVPSDRSSGRRVLRVRSVRVLVARAKE